MKRYPFLCLLTLLLLSHQGLAQPPGVAPVAHGVRNDLPRPYTTQRDWGELPTGMEWAAVTAVEPSPDGRFIYVVHRCQGNSCDGRSEPPILKYDYQGNLQDSFGAGLLVFPHGASVDDEGNVYGAVVRRRMLERHVLSD